LVVCQEEEIATAVTATADDFNSRGVLSIISQPHAPALLAALLLEAGGGWARCRVAKRCTSCP
jgi:hypothetical protein